MTRCGILAALICPLVFGAPDAQEIIRRSVAVNEANWKQAPNYSFIERDVESKHGSARTIKTYEVLMIEGSPYNRVIAVDDRPLSGREKELEEQKLQQEIQKRQHESNRERSRRTAKYLRERNQDHAMMKEMAEAFNYSLAGEETLNGHAVWVMDATPKPGYQPKSREAKVLTGMKGKMWIDKATYQWVKVDAQVVRPVSFYGFFARVGPGTRFVLEQEPVGADLWLPKHFSVRVNATALGFINENSSEDDSYHGYRPMPKAMAELQGTR